MSVYAVEGAVDTWEYKGVTNGIDQSLQGLKRRFQCRCSLAAQFQELLFLGIIGLEYVRVVYEKPQLLQESIGDRHFWSLFC